MIFLVGCGVVAADGRPALLPPGSAVAWEMIFRLFLGADAETAPCLLHAIDARILIKIEGCSANSAYAAETREKKRRTRAA